MANPIQPTGYAATTYTVSPGGQLSNPQTTFQEPASQNGGLGTPTFPEAPETVEDIQDEESTIVIVEPPPMDERPRMGGLLLLGAAAFLLFRR